MLPLAFASPREATIKSTAMLSMIPHKASYVHHARTIRGDQGKEDPRVQFALEHRVPDHYGLPLESSKMSKTGKQEGVEILRIIQPRNKTPNQDMFLLVTSSGGQIQ